MSTSHCRKNFLVICGWCHTPAWLSLPVWFHCLVQVAPSFLLVSPTCHHLMRSEQVLCCFQLHLVPVVSFSLRRASRHVDVRQLLLSPTNPPTVVLFFCVLQPSLLLFCSFTFEVPVLLIVLLASVFFWPACRRFSFFFCIGSSHPSRSA